MIGLKAKAAIGIILCAGLVTAGWQSRAWYEDSKELTAMDAVRQALESQRERESRIADTVEAMLSDRRVNERVIDRGIIREIEKPVYQRVCLEKDAIMMLNDLAGSMSDGEVQRSNGKKVRKADSK